jgi:sulfate adenylyltransferase
MADVRLSLLGIRLPFAVLGDVAAGEPPAAGRVRVPATPAELTQALTVGEAVIGDCESNPVALLTDLTVSGPTVSGLTVSGTPEPGAGWIEGALLPVDPDVAALPVRKGETRVVVAPARPLTAADVEHLRTLDIEDIVLVVPTAGIGPDGLPAAVLRQCLEQAAPSDFTLVPLPVSWRGTTVDEDVARAITTGLDGTHLHRLTSAAESGDGLAAESGNILWADTLESLQQATTAPAESSDSLLEQAMPILTRWRPPRRRRGLVVFFTGLSGSGKSTLAKALADHLATDRAVTLLDGDIVRRMLSSGLGFDRAGRDLNVRRIGFVAAEVARHGGIAVCAPIAPYAESRAAVRELVEAVGDLVLVHVATPLAECERRDVKGLYRKARAGVVTQFTGISDPYDEPLDAELRVDTTGTSLPESLAVITDYLAIGGWVPAGAGQPDTMREVPVDER